MDSVSKRTGPDSDAALQLSAGKLPPGSTSRDQTFSTRTRPDVTATKQQSAGKPKSDHHSKTSSGHTGPDVASSKHKSTGKPYTDPHRQAASSVQKSASRRISQDTLRRWERTAREASVVCNQAASFNRCLFKVQADMHDNPFAGPKTPAPSKISVHMPMEDWLCKKLAQQAKSYLGLWIPLPYCRGR